VERALERLRKLLEELKATAGEANALTSSVREQLQQLEREHAVAKASRPSARPAPAKTTTKKSSRRSRRER
jgi:hypothetical protein